MAEITDPLLDAVEDYVARSLMPLARKLLDLEHRFGQITLKQGEPGLPGRDGVDGHDGPPGAPGQDGRDGVDGKDGQNGVPGARGEPGEPGTPGAAGERGQDGDSGDSGAPGKDGEAGLQGKDGRDGAHGKDGEAGLQGKDGRDGRDAIDGLIDIQGEFDGERTFKFLFIRSAGVRQEMVFKAPIQIYRGVHQAGKAYERGDAVTLNGCQWTALHDTATAPPGGDWQQSTKAGRDGRDR